MEFTSKRRLLAAIRGEEVDHVPFSPFLAYYFDFLPEEVQRKGQLEYLKEMGADPLLRGFISAFDVQPHQCWSTETERGNKRYVTYHTPKGELYSEYTYVKEANTWFLTGHPVKGIEDIPAAIAWYQDLEVVSRINEANEQIEQLGEDGLHLALLGIYSKSSYQFLLEHVIGTENLIYLGMDYPDELRELVDVIAAQNRKTVEYTVESKIEMCISWEDSSTTNLSPALYKEYIAPEITEWNTLLKQAGKGYVQHACGHIRDLLVPMSEQGICAVESITPPPTGNVTIEEAVKKLPAGVGLIGGIEPVQLLNDSIEELEMYAEKLCRVMKGRGFILANSDSCPPGVEYEKFVRLARLVKGCRQE